MIFPWQTTQWQQLVDAKQAKRLPHALLFLGVDGIGKKEFARTFANTILCNQADSNGNVCRTCHSCRLFQANSHPDFVYIEPEESARTIKIDQIRNVVEFVNASAMQGGFRVIIIHPANAMNINASNALLKTLEEPSANTLFILISNPNSYLPATIKSRCQKIIFSKPDPATALQWLTSQLKDNTINPELLLHLADGAPLKAKNLIDNGTLTLRKDLYQGLYSLSQKQADPLQLTTQIQEFELVTIFDLLFSWARDLLRLKLTHSESELLNSDYNKPLSDLNHKISKDHILQFNDLIQKGYKAIAHSLNLNKQLLLEEIFINWTHYVSR